MYDKLLFNGKIVTESGLLEGAVAISGEKIAALYANDAAQDVQAKERLDVRGLYILPGGVDPHVHIRYPGGKLRETFSSGSLAAAAGGCTTIIEHPISTPPQHDRDSLLRRVVKVEEESIVDVAFYGAAGYENLNGIEALSKEGICAYKTFLHAAPEGRDQEFIGLTAKNNYELFEVMRKVSASGLLIAAHTEDNDMVKGNIANLRALGRTDNIAHCLSRPGLVEVLAVQRLLTIAKEIKARVYLVHISTPEAVRLALEAKKDGQEVYLETCPHYLYMDENYVRNYGAYCKCNPALRPLDMVEELWDYVMNGSFDCIGSDHAPYLVSEKEQSMDDIFVAPSGFPGIETRLGFMLKAVNEKHLPLQQVVNMISTSPAKIFGLYPRKGSIRIGADADMIILDPYKPYTINADKLFTQAKDICHFLDGITLYGAVNTTIVRGQIVFQNNKQTIANDYGKWIRPQDCRGGQL